MKHVSVCLLILCAAANAQSRSGSVSFNWHNVPSAQFKFDLDRQVIAQIMENPNAEIAYKFSTVDDLYA